MHDFENAVFNALANALEQEFSGVRVVSEDAPGEPHFPTVKMVAIDMPPDTRSSESGDMEPRTIHVFEAQCYSNRSRSEAKALAESCDALMQAWGWHRTTLMPMDSTDRTIRRYVARWRGSVDAGGMVAR